MGDLKKRYKLRRQYKLGVEDDCNYILAYTGVRCVFLNPVPAFILNSILQSVNLLETADKLRIVFNISEDDAKSIVLKVIEKLDDYIEEDNSGRQSKGFDVKKSVEILKRSDEFACPIVKAKNPRKIKFYLTSSEE